MRNRKNKIMIVMCIAVALMATGYALLSTRLNINSTTMLTDSWGVKITSIASAATGTAYNISEPTFTDTTMYFDVGVKVPGDKMTFTVTVQNTGSLDAILESIDATVDGNSSIIYSIDGIQAQTRLLAGESKTFTVTTEFDINATSLPANPINDLIIDLVYVQDDGRSLTPIGPTMLYSLSGKILGDNKAQSDAGIDFSKPSTVIERYELGEKYIDNSENLYYYYYYAEDYDFDPITGLFTLTGDMKQALPSTIDYTKYKYSCPSSYSKSCNNMIEIISVTPDWSIYDEGKVYKHNLTPIYDESNGKGLYYTSANTEDNKTTYYYRGLVDNNYVQLGTVTYSECHIDIGQYYYMFDGDDGEYYEEYFDTKSECEESLASLNVGGPAWEAATCEFEDWDSFTVQDVDRETCESLTEVCNDAGFGYFPDENGECYNEDEGLYGSLYEVDGGNYITWYGDPYLWRIVRINEDGSIRLVLDDDIDHNYNGFNNQGDNAYAGYMYGATGSGTYALTHTNTNDSLAKKTLDNWYEETLNSYSNLMADAGFCNDRSIASSAGSWNSDDTALGYGVNPTYYGSYNRIMNLKQPQFKCQNASNDLFTLKGSSKGNKALTYPVGMLSVDEIVYAGANTSRGYYYLSDGSRYSYFYMMSPAYSTAYQQCEYQFIYGDDCGMVDGTFNSYEACEAAGGECCSWWDEQEIPGSCVDRATVYMWYMDGYDSNGRQKIDFSSYYENLRPVINLKADVKITGGDGTESNPYVIYTK